MEKEKEEGWEEVLKRDIPIPGAIKSLKHAYNIITTDVSLKVLQEMFVGSRMLSKMRLQGAFSFVDFFTRMQMLANCCCCCSFLVCVGFFLWGAMMGGGGGEGGGRGKTRGWKEGRKKG